MTNQNVLTNRHGPQNKGCNQASADSKHYLVSKHLLVPVSVQSVKVTFCLFQSLCSSDDVYKPISSPYISTCIACCALLFGSIMYLSTTYKPCKKCTCLMRIYRVTVLMFSRPCICSTMGALLCLLSALV